MNKDTKFLFGILCMILIIGGYVSVTNNKKAEKLEYAIEAYVQKVKNIGLSYGIADMQVDVRQDKSSGYLVCMSEITGSGTNTFQKEKLYELVWNLENLRIEAEGISPRTIINLDGFEYSIARWNEKMLLINGEEMFTYVSAGEKAVQASLANALPYEGMSEKYIGNTSLGEADKCEKCPHYDQLKRERRSKTYYWYNSNQSLKARAVVYFDDDELAIDGYGYVDSFETFTHDNSDKREYSKYYPDSYDKGYESIYEDDDFDWDLYDSDPEYADGVDDAMDELDW